MVLLASSTGGGHSERGGKGGGGGGGEGGGDTHLGRAVCRPLREPELSGQIAQQDLFEAFPRETYSREKNERRAECK